MKLGLISDIYKHCPWWKNPGSDEKHIEDFHNSNLHCSIPRYEYATANEFLAMVSQMQKSMNVNTNSILQWWTIVDSHFVFESHLPQLISLDYIDNVCTPKNLFESLSADAQRAAKIVFKDTLTLNDHLIDLSVITACGTLSLDYTRKSYLKYTLEKSIEKIYEKIDSNGKNQFNLRCLICYIAEKPSSERDDYHDKYSCLNIGHPHQYFNYVHNKYSLTHTYTHTHSQFGLEFDIRALLLVQFI
ncbi:hypothetical protein I4U23_022748 [Adineta vaga]|nr:hypothetical protein I4U23_022748 [Adineta vaga]